MIQLEHPLIWSDLLWIFGDLFSAPGLAFLAVQPVLLHVGVQITKRLSWGCPITPPLVSVHIYIRGQKSRPASGRAAKSTRGRPTTTGGAQSMIIGYLILAAHCK
jgi:hypothetical protein